MPRPWRSLSGVAAAEQAAPGWWSAAGRAMRHVAFPCAGAGLLVELAGALVWPAHELVVVADLHLEKGSSFARRGRLLPPYDTPATLARLERVLAHWRPRRVISLGDGFHDPGAADRLAAADRDRLLRLTRRFDWLWLAGNHDPAPPEGLGGRSEEAVAIGGIVFRHLPTADPAAAEVTGHLHPSASLSVRGRRLARRCFVNGGRRLLMPAFGSYAGGLDVFDPAIAALFEGGFRVALLGERRIHVLPQHRLHRREAPPGPGVRS